MQAITIGLDLAKHWFQVMESTRLERSSSGEGCAGPKVVAFFRDQEPCLAGMEA